MSHEIICGWLGLQPDEWPPNHYRLLDLTPGETDAGLIEQRVHERLDTVRCYQMLHPDQATEAMNRLAQAFVCLTEPAAKKLYDASLLGTTVGTAALPTSPSGGPTSAAEADTVIEIKDPLSWLTAAIGPPPLPRTKAPTPGAVADGANENASTTVPPPLPTVQPPPEPVDAVVEAAQSSREARRGLGTKRALYHRIALTRKLLRTWDQIGQHLGVPKKRPLRRAEVIELLDRITEVRDLLVKFPPLLGEAGQPGYLVLTLDQVEPNLLQKIASGQREQLGNDWKAGYKLLTAHCAFLRRETRALRNRSWRNRLLGATQAFFSDHPVVILILCGVLAIAIAVGRSRVFPWLGR